MLQRPNLWRDLEGRRHYWKISNFWRDGQEATSNPSNPNWWLLEATRPHQMGYYVCKLFLTCFPFLMETDIIASSFPHAPAEMKAVPRLNFPSFPWGDLHGGRGAHMRRVRVAPGGVPAAPPQTWSFRTLVVAGESCCLCSRKAAVCPHHWQAFLLLTAPSSQPLLTAERGMLLPA